MQAFMSGQIKVEGDMSKLMAMQSSGGGGADQAAMQEKLKAITADD
jgi:putative sterol carrier protein